MIRRFASVLAVTSALCASSCIVTDKIEFEDYVNNPPEVIDIEPDNKIIEKMCREPQVFEVVVWDPDEGDAASYAARIRMYLPSTSEPAPFTCTVGPVTVPEQPEEYETGVQRKVTCAVDLAFYQGLEDGTLLLFEVEVSDLGYNQSALPDGARTAEVLWIKEIMPDSWGACGG